ELSSPFGKDAVVRAEALTRWKHSRTSVATAVSTGYSRRNFPCKPVTASATPLQFWQQSDKSDRIRTERCRIRSSSNGSDSARHERWRRDDDTGRNTVVATAHSRWLDSGQTGAEGGRGQVRALTLGGRHPSAPGSGTGSGAGRLERLGGAA